MKKSNVVGSLVVAGLLVIALATALIAAPQATKKAAPTGLTSEQAASLNTAWRHLARAYQDLLTASPDVKGDTAKLESILKAAIHALHQVDPSLAEASGLQGQDRGKNREVVFNAVQQHLDMGKQYIEASKVKSVYCDQALSQIKAAYAELSADRTAAVK